MTNNAPENPNNEAPLESWKEIAVYVQRDVSTVMRWEKHEGLPVHRHHHLSRSSVYAYPSELDAWRVNRKPVTESTRSGWWRPVPAFLTTVTIALALLMAGSGPHTGATVQAADGLVTRQVWTASSIEGSSMSPDGRYLVFADFQNRSGDLAVRDVRAGTTRYLTNEASDNSLTGGGLFSPDGEKIVYGWYDSNVLRELRIVNRDGTGERLLRHGDGKMSLFLRDWSGDGKRILALRMREANPRNIRERKNEIVSISAGDGSIKVLKKLNWRFGKMVFSPDGRYVAYDFPSETAPSAHDIYLISSDGGGDSVLVEHPAFDYVLDWSPDGKWLFFVSDRTGDWALYRVAVRNGETEGLPELVKGHIGMITGIGRVSSGALYYTLGGAVRDVYGADLDPAAGRVIGKPHPAIERFMGSNAGPAWSPDGKRLAYISRRYPPPQTSFLCIRNEETGEERDLRPALTWFRNLHWFPDGRSILATGVGLDGTMAYFRIDAETGAASPLFSIVFRGMAPFAALSPGGKQVFYKQPRDERAPERIVGRDLVSGKERVICSPPDGAEFVELAISPDGKMLAAKLNRSDKGPYGLAVVPAGGGELREVARIQPPHWFQNVAWMPDGSHLLFTKHFWKDKRPENVELWRVDVGSGEEEPLGLSMIGMRDLCIHPAGRRIACTLQRFHTEVWVMKNLLPTSLSTGR